MNLTIFRPLASQGYIPFPHLPDYSHLTDFLAL